MDGSFTTAADPSSGSPPFFGILYAEDFDDPADTEPTPVASAPPVPPPITQDDVDAACADAVLAARAEWQASQDQARVAALHSLNAQLAGMHEDATRLAHDAAEGAVLTILAMVAGLLPHFAREHGPAEVHALLARVLPMIHSQQTILVRVHPDLVASVKADVGGMDTHAATPIEVVAGPLERGDVKVTWENGSMTRDSRQIAQAIQDALGQLGLHHAAEAPAKRMMAHA